MEIDGSITLDTNAVIKIVLNALADSMNNTLRQGFATIKKSFESLIDVAIRATPEYDSLVNGGELQGQLGVVNPGPIAQAIIKAIQDAMAVDVKPVRTAGDSLMGGLSLSFLRSDFSEAIAVQGTSFISEGGHLIEWLKWLLFRGDERFIRTYQYTHKIHEGHPSRTGFGIMVGGGDWGVPAVFAGTVNDNWLTRAFEGITPAMVGDIFMKGLGLA
jgi:hypothetical protein